MENFKKWFERHTHKWQYSEDLQTRTCYICFHTEQTPTYLILRAKNGESMEHEIKNRGY